MRPECDDPARRGRPLIDESELQRERIVLEAMQVIEEQGAASLTIRKLARRLDRAPATVYSHLKSKDELFARVARMGFEQLVRATREAAEREDVREAIAEGSRRYLDFALANPRLYKLMFDDFDIAAYRKDLAVSQPGRALFDLYRDLYARGVESGCLRKVDPEVQTVITWSALHGFAMLSLSGRMPPPRMPGAALSAIRESFLGFLDQALRP